MPLVFRNGKQKVERQGVLLTAQSLFILPPGISPQWGKGDTVFLTGTMLSKIVEFLKRMIHNLISFVKGLKGAIL